MYEELEEIRRRRMAELQRQIEQQRRLEEEQIEKQRRIEIQKQAILRQILDPDARSRLANLKMVRQEFATQVENLLVQMAQSGKITRRITDKEFKALLVKLQSGRNKDITIRRF